MLTLPDLLRIDRVTPFAQVVSFRPYLLVGVAALVLVLAGLSWRRRRLLLPAVALLAVLAVGAGMTAPRTQAGPLPAGGQPVTVLAVNALDGSADVAEMAELIRSERPDLGALIEVGPWYRDRLAPLVEPLGYRFITATGTDSDGITDVFGVSVLVAAHLGEVTSTAGTSTQFPIVEVEGGGLGATRFVAFHAVAPVLVTCPSGARTCVSWRGTAPVASRRSSRATSTRRGTIRRCAMPPPGAPTPPCSAGRACTPPGRPRCRAGSARRSTTSSSRTRSRRRTSRPGT
ncbi:hypothetical protein BJF90_32640 [Pseudonocardia sp. CNS-004]|nr:hypothetical protein BJF90_32640 [Pseudonocardia sp. CNS-004]